MKSLHGKVALVTGASKGIGRSIATRLGTEGALVAVHYGSDQEGAESVVKEIERKGGNSFAIGAKFGSNESITTFFHQLDQLLEQRTGSSSFDILVNNAGTPLSAQIEETTEEAFDEVMNINVKTPFFLTQQALPRLRDEGRIINISSAVTRISLPGIPAYSMSKAAIDSLTLALSTQVAARNITINAIQPGFVATDMNAGMLNDPDLYKFGAGFSAFGRWGQPEDIADVAAFLASPDSRWVTGQSIDASGGSHL
ncbi:SDR family oxidoreductase [Bacillus sp. FJAT-49711]|uniref:SDR family oxidoreductase n=1 Tax=Bacillus sp. FJAT-49711 TaxID=2833585 RepID=UPI001BC9919D|nr:SDR family oxidoreductase [Bacillus sp. FJAT-49711]MBS4218288.1 SDR family oxidoreductase [Bacillus sp. FJAT-49711]